MTEQTLSERIKRDGITLTYNGPAGMNDAGTHYLWAVTLHRPDGASFTLPDPWEDNEEPTAFSVLDLVTGALNIVCQSADRREWASNFTSDPEQQDKHFTSQHWNTWQGISEGVLALLGHQRFEDYLYETDRSA